MKKNGFTLSEVLIALVIIGVIAAITIPSIMLSTEKKEFVVRLNKAYSMLNQGLLKIAKNNGYPIGDYTFLKEDMKLLEEFEKVSNVIKKCDNIRDCYGDNEFIKYTFLNGTPADDAFANGSTIITMDGMSFTFPYGTTFANFGISEEDYYNNINVIIVDVNTSIKKPNKGGIDTFLFYLIDGKGIIPAGSHSFAECNRNNLGGSCTAKVLKEDKINY